MLLYCSGNMQNVVKYFRVLRNNFNTPTKKKKRRYSWFSICRESVGYFHPLIFLRWYMFALKSLYDINTNTGRDRAYPFFPSNSICKVLPSSCWGYLTLVHNETVRFLWNRTGTATHVVKRRYPVHKNKQVFTLGCRVWHVTASTKIEKQ